MSLRRLERDEARQVAVRAQLLDATRPTNLVDLVDHLTLLQVDPTAAIAPNADLVAWSRLGDAYQPADLARGLENDRTLFELRAFIRPMTAVALHVPEETRYTADSSVRAWLEANDGFRRDIIARLRDCGPLLSRDIPDTSQIPWGSTGWTNDRNVTQMMELLSARGEVAIAGRTGRQRLWDLPERVYPSFRAPFGQRSQAPAGGATAPSTRHRPSQDSCGPRRAALGGRRRRSSDGRGAGWRMARGPERA